MRHNDSAIVSMHTTVGAAAGLIVSERDRDIPRFEPWKATSSPVLSRSLSPSSLSQYEDLAQIVAMVHHGPPPVRRRTCSPHPPGSAVKSRPAAGGADTPVHSQLPTAGRSEWTNSQSSGLRSRSTSARLSSTQRRSLQSSGPLSLSISTSLSSACTPFQLSGFAPSRP